MTNANNKNTEKDNCWGLTPRLSRAVSAPSNWARKKSWVAAKCFYTSLYTNFLDMMMMMAVRCRGKLKPFSEQRFAEKKYIDNNLRAIGGVAILRRGWKSPAKSSLTDRKVGNWKFNLISRKSNFYGYERQQRWRWRKASAKNFILSSKNIKLDVVWCSSR